MALGPVWWWGPSAITLSNVVGDYYSTQGRRYMSVKASHFTEIRLFVQQLVGAYNKESIKAPLNCSFVCVCWGGFPCDWGEWGIPITKGQQYAKCFHDMTWSWEITTYKTLPLFYSFVPGFTVLTEGRESSVWQLLSSLSARRVWVSFESRPLPWPTLSHSCGYACREQNVIKCHHKYKILDENA